MKVLRLRGFAGVVGGGDVAGSSAHRPRTASTGSKAQQQQQHYDDSGPVDITARVHQKVGSEAVSYCNYILYLSRVSHR